MMGGALVFIACSGPGGQDAGTDVPPAMDVELTAVPDPAERTDCPAAPPAAGEARAKHVVCAAELVDGSLAMGRIGDIVIENSRARFIVRTGEQAASTIGSPGGGLIDGARQGGVDLIKEVFPLFDLVSMGPTALEIVDAGGDEARVRVLFEDAPIGLVESVFPGLAGRVRLRGQLDYVLRADEDVLRIELDLTTENGAARSSASTGLLALLGGMELWTPGYAVLDDDHLGSDASAIVVGERPGSAVALALTRDGSVAHLATLQMLRTPRVSFFQGMLARVEARVGVGTTAAEALAAASSSDDPVLALEGTAGDRVELIDAAGVLQLRSSFDDAGHAEVRLPAGDYTARAGIRGLFETSPVTVTHPSATIVPAPAGTIVVAASADGDATAPVRVTVMRAGEELERFVARGETMRRFPPGDYTVVISHGLEYDASTTDVTLADGAMMRFEPDLLRAIDTTDWVSVDLHLHSDLSTDSLHAVEDAVRLLAAEGVQSAAATDHDFITDYAAMAARASVDDVLVVVPGVEVSTTVFGHIGGYPLVPNPDLAGQGAPVWFEMSPSQVFDYLRSVGDGSLGGALVQINHPRLGSASFFNSIALDPTTGLATADPASLGLPADTDLNDFGFDVLEIWNGYTRGENETSFADYLALFELGRRFTMVGNSDSHRPDKPPGSPRSFVPVPDEAAFGWNDVATSLRAGNATVAAGLFVTATLEGPRIADTVPVHVRVQAPPWAQTTQLRIYAGQSVAVERALDPGDSAPVRLDEVIDVPLGGADFVVVRADGARAPEPIQHFPPIGVTNPLVVP